MRKGREGIAADQLVPECRQAGRGGRQLLTSMYLLLDKQVRRVLRRKREGDKAVPGRKEGVQRVGVGTCLR